MSFKKKISYVLLIILNVYLYYYSYRYILKYNSTSTSPTYSDTPTLFKLLKYLLIFVLLLIFILYACKKKIKIRGKRIILFLAVLLLMLQEVYCFIVARGFDQLIFAMCLAPPLLMITFDYSMDAKFVDKTFEIFVYIAIVYELIQVGLFFLTKRLPALAYDTGVITDVRFGSVWDDPNGFGIFLAFLIPYSYMKFKGIKKIIITLILIGMLGLTWSLTAFLAVAAISVLGIIVSILKDTKRNIVIYIITIAAIIIGFFAALIKIDSIVTLFENKMGSITEHLESFRFNDFTVYQFIGIIPKTIDFESGGVRLLYIGGILHFILFYGLSITSLVRLRILARKSSYSRLYLAMFWFIIAFLVAGVNLPLMYNFAIYGIYCLFIGYSFIPLYEDEEEKENAEW